MATKKIETVDVKDLKDSNANPYVNKVVYGNTTLIDLTSDTATAADVLTGKTMHDKSGAEVTGTCDYDSNTTDADASASEILLNKTAYVNKNKLTGTMPNNGGQIGTISTVAGEVSIAQGYHDGSGKVSISADQQALLIPENIKEAVTVLGVTGTHSGSESVKAVEGSATPYTTSKLYVPTDFGADKTHISQFTVNAIAYTEVDNTAGGKTVTIGTVAP